MTRQQPNGAVALVHKAISFEIAMWRSLYQWVGRRYPGTTEDAQSFGYSGVAMPTLWAFIGVSIVEIPILHLILPWPWVRGAMLAIGIYGLLWMFGLLASMRVNTHMVDAVGLRIRSGVTLDVSIPWADIAEIRTHHHVTPPGTRGVRLEHTDSRTVLFLAVAGHADIDVMLASPRQVPVPRTKGEPVDQLCIAADDPAALVTAARNRMAANAPRRPH
jgi:hypothetical protein